MMIIMTNLSHKHKTVNIRIRKQVSTFTNPGHLGTIFYQNHTTFHAEMVL